jgi:drug/metabolite transporter (DMT)-like permease
MSDRQKAVRNGLLVLLCAGWLLGLGAQVWTRQQTGYMDVVPPQILLGVLLCLGAGAAARIADRTRRTWRRGSLAGMAMLGSIIGGYLLLTVVMWNPVWSEEEGETWFSFLLEAWFWVGVPLAVGAGFGALGWVAVDRLMRGEPQSIS